jgi:hypothetical protein
MPLHYRLPRIRAADIAWAAGLFIGEGCVGISHSRKKVRTFHYLGLQLSMYDERAVARFARIFALNYQTHWLKRQKHYIYKVFPRGRTAEKILAAMWPHLRGTDKGDQAVAKASKLRILGWITGTKQGRRRQLQLAHRGRKPS